VNPAALEEKIRRLFPWYLEPLIWLGALRLLFGPMLELLWFADKFIAALFVLLIARALYASILEFVKGLGANLDRKRS
jgi:hypothetical protein